MWSSKHQAKYALLINEFDGGSEKSIEDAAERLSLTLFFMLSQLKEYPYQFYLAYPSNLAEITQPSMQQSCDSLMQDPSATLEQKAVFKAQEKFKETQREYGFALDPNLNRFFSLLPVPAGAPRPDTAERATQSMNNLTNVMNCKISTGYLTPIVFFWLNPTPTIQYPSFLYTLLDHFNVRRNSIDISSIYRQDTTSGNNYLRSSIAALFEKLQITNSSSCHIM